MLRWLAIAVLVFSTSASAQVFKPGKSTPTGGSGSSGSSSSSSSSSAKKSSTSSKKSSAKKSSKKTKKKEPAVDPDYVKITDDDDE